MEKAFDICCGIDVGKWSHHFAAMDCRTGEVLLDREVDQSEAAIRGVLSHLASLGRLQIVVDQPGSMAALLFATADDMGIEKGFITPKAMAQAIEMYGGDLKTDAHDAFIIAEVSANLPRLIKPVGERSDVCLRLATLMSYDRELTSEATRASNRLHDLLLSICPALETHFQGKRLQSAFCLELLRRYGGLVGLKNAGRGNVRRWVRSRKGMGEAALRKVDELFDAIGEQGIEIKGSCDIEELVKMEAGYLLGILSSRKAVASKRDGLLTTLPDAQLLMTLPGTGSITCATFLAEVGDISRFGNAAKLASYAGLSPRVRQSGKTIHSASKPRGGNRRLKRVLVISASKSILFCEESKAYYDRKRAEGRSYGSAVTALARRRLNVMYAMLRDGKAYEKN